MTSIGMCIPKLGKLLREMVFVFITLLENEAVMKIM